MDIVAFNLALIIILGIIVSRVFTSRNIPGFIGVIFLGIIIGPSGLNLIGGKLLDISSDIASIALVIILFRAGLGLNRESLRKAGVAAVEMSCIPCICEGLLVMFASTQLLGMSFLEGGMLGFILASVAPAILVPPMLDFIERKKGTAKGIPALLMAGSSADDVVSITIFSVFLGSYVGGNASVGVTLLGIPVSLILGIIIGLIAGILLIYIFRNFDASDTEKVLITLSVGILLNSIGQASDGSVPIAGLLGVMVMGFVIVDRKPELGVGFSDAFGKLWTLAEVLIFAMLGIQLDVGIAIKYIPIGLLIVCIGLVGRYIGVYISLLSKRDLTFKERVFCMLAYTPKSSAQAAIAPLPLAAGVPSGGVILAITVIAILFTAPLGAIFIKVLGERILSDDSISPEVKAAIA